MKSQPFSQGKKVVESPEKVNLLITHVCSSFRKSQLIRKEGGQTELFSSS
jgi:hypothetical protein